MQRSLKQATASPPAWSLRVQQQVFDHFRQQYNWERPHQALEMQIPGERDVPSERSYPRRLAEPEYADDWEVRRVRECGRMRWWSESIFVGRMFVGEAVGLEPVADV